MPFQYGQVVERLAVITTSGTTTALTNVSLQNQVFTGTSSQTITLPDATTMSIGQNFSIYNQSTSPLTLHFHDGTAFTDAAGNSYGSLPTNTPLLFILQTNGASNGTWAVLSTPAPSSNPSGTILAFGGSSAPTGYVLCDGSAISRTTFATLFSVISTTYGVGDGSTTFNVPNSQGVFMRGKGSQTIGGISYTGTPGTTQGDQLQGHFHTTSESAHNHSQNAHTHNMLSNNATIAGATTGWTAQSANTFGNANIDSTAATNNANTTGLAVVAPLTDGTNGTPRTGTETRPANISVTYIIKI